MQRPGGGASLLPLVLVFVCRAGLRVTRSAISVAQLVTQHREEDCLRTSFPLRMVPAVGEFDILDRRHHRL